MGADLYIDELPEDEGGYFRDSYNVTSIMWTMILSWWELYDVYSLDENDSKMTPDQAEKFIKLVNSRDKEFEESVASIGPEWAEEKHASWSDDPESSNSKEGWTKYYREKRVKLVEFFQGAIDGGYNIQWYV